jgi:hypothetical protein
MNVHRESTKEPDLTRKNLVPSKNLLSSSSFMRAAPFGAQLELTCITKHPVFPGRPLSWSSLNRAVNVLFLFEAAQTISIKAATHQAMLRILIAGAVYDLNCSDTRERVGLEFMDWVPLPLIGNFGTSS